MWPFLGKIHTKLLSQSENYKLIGIYDKDNEESIRVSNEFKCTSFESFDSLLDSVDVIDIVAPTPFISIMQNKPLIKISMCSLKNLSAIYI